MSQASVTTTIPPVTVVCSGTSSFLMTVTMTPTLMGLPTTSGQYDVVVLPLLMLRDRRGVGLTTLPHQQPQSQLPL